MSLNDAQVSTKIVKDAAQPDKSSMKEFMLKKCAGQFRVHEAEGQDVKVSCAPVAAPPSPVSEPTPAAPIHHRNDGGIIYQKDAMDSLSDADQETLREAVRAAFLAHGNSVHPRQLDDSFKAHHGQTWEQFTKDYMHGINLATFVACHMPEFFHFVPGAGAAVACTLNAEGKLPPARRLSHPEGPLHKSNRPFRVVPCTYFAAGHCPRGNKCTYRHDPNDLVDNIHAAAAPQTVNKPLVSSSSELVVEGEEKKQMGAGVGAGVSSSNSGRSAASSSAAASSSSSSSSSSFQPQYKDGKPYKVIPCWHWAQGRCDRGAKCTFGHDEADKKAAPPVASGPSVSLADYSAHWRKPAPAAEASSASSSSTPAPTPMKPAAPMFPSPPPGYAAAAPTPIKSAGKDREKPVEADTEMHKQIAAASPPGPSAAPPTVAPPRRLSDSDLLELVHQAIEEFHAPVLLSALGLELRKRHGNLFASVNASAAVQAESYGSIKAFIDAHPQHFKRHETDNPLFPCFSWKKSNNEQVHTPPGGAAAPSGDFSSMIHESAVTFSPAASSAAAGRQPEPFVLDMSFDSASVVFEAAPAVAPVTAPANVAVGMPSFETHPPADVKMDISTPAYSNWYWTRGPGSVAHLSASAVGASSSSEGEVKKQIVAPLQAAPAAVTPAATAPAASPIPVAFSTSSAAAASSSPSPIAPTVAQSTSSASSSSGSTQAKLVRVLVQVPGLAKAVKVAAESIDELRHELSEMVDDEELLSDDALASVIFSVLPPTPAVPSPTPLTDELLWSLERDTSLYLSWRWCRASFNTQTTLLPSITRESICRLCGAPLTHPKHNKPEE